MKLLNGFEKLYAHLYCDDVSNHNKKKEERIKFINIPEINLKHMDCGTNENQFFRDR